MYKQKVDKIFNQLLTADWETSFEDSIEATRLAVIALIKDELAKQKAELEIVKNQAIDEAIATGSLEYAYNKAKDKVIERNSYTGKSRTLNENEIQALWNI